MIREERGKEMITGEVKNKLDKLWNAMWSNNMTNPWVNLQQITYLIFIKMLDDSQIKQEKKINDQIQHGINVELKNPTFKSGNYVDDDEKIDVPYSYLRWSVFKEFPSEKLYDNMAHNVFPFVKKLHGEKTTAFATFMKDAQFTVPTAYILSRIVECLSDEGLGFNDKDLMGDCYEYLLAMMSTSGDNGQFRTPRHIIDMMVELADPKLDDTVLDPAMGTAGFLAETAKFIQEKYSKELFKKENNEHFHNKMFTGYDIDPDMLRIGCMNMTLHGVENPTIAYNNSLSEEYTAKNSYSLILANPPFSGVLEPSQVSKSLNQICGGTKKTELLFLSLFLRVLEVGGRCITIVPVGVVNNTNNKAYKNLRQQLVEKQKLDFVIYMPNGVFKPYAGVQTAIIGFTKTNSGGTNKVWLYNMENDGFSLDDKRTPIEANDILDIINRYKNLKDEEGRSKKEKSFLISKQDIIDNDYVLSFNKYQEREIIKKEYKPTSEILKNINDLEKQFNDSYQELLKMLNE